MKKQPHNPYEHRPRICAWMKPHPDGLTMEQWREHRTAVRIIRRDNPTASAKDIARIGLRTRHRQYSLPAIEQLMNENPPVIR